MGKNTTSRTGRESYLEESVASALVGGSDSHSKTTITDGNRTYEGRGRTSEESERNASDKYHGR